MTRRRTISVLALLVSAPAACVSPSEDVCATCLHDAGGGDPDADAAPPLSGQDAAATSTVDAGSSPSAAAFLRLANFAFDAPAIDVCLVRHGASDALGPLLVSSAGLAGGDAAVTLPAFGQASAYVRVAPGSYDARVVSGGASDCHSSIMGATATIPPLAAGAAATLALVGQVSPSSARPGLRLATFVDELRVTQPGPIEVRVVNAATAAPSIDVGTGAESEMTFQPFFEAVAFGAASSETETSLRQPYVDGNGYVSAVSYRHVTVSAHAHGASRDDALAKLSAADGAVVTLFVIDRDAVDAGPSPLAIVACIDNAGTAGSLSSCGALTP